MSTTEVPAEDLDAALRIRRLGRLLRGLVLASPLLAYGVLRLYVGPRAWTDGRAVVWARDDGGDWYARRWGGGGTIRLNPAPTDPDAFTVYVGPDGSWTLVEGGDTPEVLAHFGPSRAMTATIGPQGEPSFEVREAWRLWP